MLYVEYYLKMREEKKISHVEAFKRIMFDKIVIFAFFLTPVTKERK